VSETMMSASRGKTRPRVWRGLSFANKRQILGERLGQSRAGLSLALRGAVNCGSKTPQDDILARFGSKHPCRVIFQPCLSSNNPAG
jgi:hypothetical protein